MAHTKPTATTREAGTAPALPLPLLSAEARRAKADHGESERKRSATRRPRPDAGFTLVEVVVALAILALSLSVVFTAMSNGTWRVGQADAAAKAGSLVQSVLARAGAELPLREGRAEGQLPDGFAWTLQVQRFGDAADRAQWPLAAYVVTAEVFWDEASTRRSVALSTIRLGAKETGR
jgi:general secretion pathway protein I